MTYDQKLALAAEMRKGTGLDAGMPTDNSCSVTATKEPAYVVKDGWKLSVVPLPPPSITEDLSHLNSDSWKKLQAAGRKNGRRKKR